MTERDELAGLVGQDLDGAVVVRWPWGGRVGARARGVAAPRKPAADRLGQQRLPTLTPRAVVKQILGPAALIAGDRRTQWLVRVRPRRAALFTHSVFEFRDRRFLQKDKLCVLKVQVEYLMNHYLRQLVLTGDTTERTPFPLQPGEALMLRAGVEELLVDEGMSQPRIEVVGGSAREARGHRPVEVGTDEGSDSP